MIVFQVFIKFWSSERNTEDTKSNLYFNEESDYSEENTCENKVFRSTILPLEKKLNIFMPQMPIYCIQYYNRKSRLVQMPEATTGGVLLKKVFFKISKNSQETPVPEETLLSFAKFLRPLLQNKSGRLLLKCGHCKNEERNRLSLL